MKRSLMTGIIALSSITSFIGTDHALGQVYKAGQTEQTGQTYTYRVTKTPHKILRPTKSPVNQDFMMTYTFDAPGRTINMFFEDFSVDNGTLIDLEPLPANVFKLKIRPNSNFRDYGEQVTVRTSKHGDSQVSIQITEPTSYASGNTPTSDSSVTTLHLHVLHNQGGEGSVSGTGHNLGDGNEVQFGLSIPLGSHKNASAIRLNLGYREGVSGFKPNDDFNIFTSGTADLLYSLRLTKQTSLLGGVTYAFDPKLYSQNAELRGRTVEGDINFDNALGAKIAIEHKLYGRDGADIYLIGGATMMSLSGATIHIDGQSHQLDEIKSNMWFVGFGVTR